MTDRQNKDRLQSGSSGPPDISGGRRTKKRPANLKKDREFGVKREKKPEGPGLGRQIQNN